MAREERETSKLRLMPAGSAGKLDGQPDTVPAKWRLERVTNIEERDGRSPTWSVKSYAEQRIEVIAELTPYELAALGVDVVNSLAYRGE